MSSSARAAVIVAAVVVAVAAFLILRPGDEEGDSPEPRGQDTTQLTRPSETTPPDETEPRAREPRATEPEVPPIEVRRGKPVGGVEEFLFEKGDTIEFAVTSDRAYEVHLHGYDVSKNVKPGGTVRFKLEADIEGVFEVELEETHEQIAELKVTP